MAHFDNAASVALFDRATVICVRDGKIVTNELTLISGGVRGVTNQPPDGYWPSFKGDFVTVTNLYRGSDGSDFIIGSAYPFHYSDGFPFMNPSDPIISISRSGIAGFVRLIPTSLPLKNQEGDPKRHELSFETNSVKVHTIIWRFVSPHVLVDGVGPTESLWKWEQTTISGLTTEPIVLKGYFSQTYFPGRHNAPQFFLFEPRLEDGISPVQVEQLEFANIHQITAAFGLFIWDPSNPVVELRNQIELVGKDGKKRPIPPQ